MADTLKWFRECPSFLYADAGFYHTSMTYTNGGIPFMWYMANKI